MPCTWSLPRPQPSKQGSSGRDTNPPARYAARLKQEAALRSTHLLFAASITGLLAGHALAQDKPVAITGAKVIPISGPELEHGVLIVQGGKITACGDEKTVKIPQGADVIDAKGKIVMPGLVDTHSHIGGIGGADGSSPIQPDVRVLDSLSVLDSGFRRAVAGGLTTLNIMPGSGHLMSGQTIYAKMRKAKKIDDIFILDKDAHFMNGLKMANGTNSFGAPPFSSTRAKSAALVREEYVKAQEYKKKVEAAKTDPEKAPVRDLGLDFLSEVLDGKKIVHFHTHRADDIMTVIRLHKEFGFRVVLHHVSEAWKIADEIAAANVPCSVIVIDSPGGKLEAAELSWATGGVLEKAGVKVAFHTDDWITDSRLFMRLRRPGRPRPA